MLKSKCPSCGERKREVIHLWRRRAQLGPRIQYTTLVFVACRACNVYRIISAVDLKEEEEANA